MVREGGQAEDEWDACRDLYHGSVGTGRFGFEVALIRLGKLGTELSAQGFQEVDWFVVDSDIFEKI
jgi:hypothetical protein